jgi:hypothetical protein
MSFPSKDFGTAFVTTELLEHQQPQKKRKMDLNIAMQATLDRSSTFLEKDENYFKRAKKILESLPREYNPDPEWIKTHNFPDIHIFFSPKAGTSQLYKILTSHPDCEPFNKRTKEYCMDQQQLLDYDTPNDQLFATLHQFHKQTMNQTSKARRKTTINGCLNYNEIFFYTLYVKDLFHSTEKLRSIWDKKRFIMIFRDPADILYSYFNFWVIDGFDNHRINQKKGSWALAKLDYRSPELFHEIILSGNRTAIGLKWLRAMRLFYDLGTSVIEMVGRERVIFLKNEDMLPGVVDLKGGLVDQLSKLTNLAREKFPQQVLNSKTNCNNAENNRGPKRTCNVTSNSEGYAVNGNRPMIPETRQLIYVIMSKECQLWSEHFGIVYDDCIGALPRQ